MAWGYYKDHVLFFFNELAVWHSPYTPFKAIWNMFVYYPILSIALTRLEFFDMPREK